MTDKNTTAAHTRAKGQSTHAKPGGRTTARADAETAIERKRPPAKAAAQKPRQTGERRRAGESAPSTKRGLADLKQEARNMVEKDVRQLLKGLKAKARKGSATDVKLLVNLAGLTEQKQQTEAKPDDESRMAMLHRLSSEPEYNEAEDGLGAGDSQSVILQPADGAAAKQPAEIDKEIA